MAKKKAPSRPTKPTRGTSQSGGKSKGKGGGMKNQEGAAGWKK